MNPKWSEMNKTVQTRLKKESTFSEGIGTLFALRADLFSELLRLRAELNRSEFSAIPFLGANGYHSKTIAYSVWHIFRIEDIVAHTLIAGDGQIFFTKNYRERIGAPIITTGNELVGERTAEFSEQLDLDELYRYAAEVREETERLLNRLSFADLKRKMTEEDKARLVLTETVSGDENAKWLIGYWCGKDVRGLIQMPFSRHWIMHIEASLRIRQRLSAIGKGRKNDC